MVERVTDNDEVEGPIPSSPTKEILNRVTPSSRKGDRVTDNDEVEGPIPSSPTNTKTTLIFQVVLCHFCMGQIDIR